MDLEEVREKARKRLRSICRVCRICNGRDCIGTMPGMGGKGTGASFRNNATSLERVLLNMRTIHDVTDPDPTYTLFGRKLAFPILGAPMCETKYNFRAQVGDVEFIESQVAGAKEAGTLAMTGDSAQTKLFQMGLEAIKKAGGLGIPVIKPRTGPEIVRLTDLARQAGAVAVGIDIDAAAYPSFARAGQQIGPKTAAQLGEIIKQCLLPVILKGIMVVDDALAAVEAGAAGIVVSNHGGRALDHTPGTAAVLPEIAAAVKGELRVFMDGGIRSGEDILKALALGAESVLVGRPIAIAAIGGQAAGVKLQFEQLAAEFRTAMLLTGCRKLDEIGPHVVRNAFID